MQKLYIIVLHFMVAVSGHMAVAEVVIEVPVTGSISGFGLSTPYRGQAFTTPNFRIETETVTIYIPKTADRGARFRLLLTETTMSDGFHPTRVIFESDTIEVPIDVSRRFIEHTIPLPSLTLSARTQYALIFDYFVVASPEFVSMATAAHISGEDGTGFQVELPSGPFLPSGSRGDHFSGKWLIYDPPFTSGVGPGSDFSFRLFLRRLEDSDNTAVVPAAIVPLILSD